MYFQIVEHASYSDVHMSEDVSEVSSTRDIFEDSDNTSVASSDFVESEPE